MVVIAPPYLLNNIEPLVLLTLTFPVTIYCWVETGRVYQSFPHWDLEPATFCAITWPLELGASICLVTANIGTADPTKSNQICVCTILHSANIVSIINVFFYISADCKISLMTSKSATYMYL